MLFRSSKVTECASLTYTRTFTNTNWQALYVPFEIPVTEELLADRVRLTVMRAPIDNERYVKSKWYKDNANVCEGFDRLFNKCYSAKISDNAITVNGSLSGISRQPFLHYALTYTFNTDGTIKMTLNADVREDCFWLPRLGFEFRLPKDADKFSYFGRGPY